VLGLKQLGFRLQPAGVEVLTRPTCGPNWQCHRLGTTSRKVNRAQAGVMQLGFRLQPGGARLYPAEVGVLARPACGPERCHRPGTTSRKVSRA
jgi:hypothetical protein